MTHESPLHKLLGLYQHPDWPTYGLLKKKNLKVKLRFLKRLSPFLLLTLLLLVLFPFMFLTGKGFIQSGWFLIALFPFTITNILIIDFALWNYFAGKKVLLIWLIEFTLSLFIVYLLCKF